VAQLQTFNETVKNQISHNKAVAVHCAGGKGRTGTFLASWLVTQGQGADDAITNLRSLRPSSVETAEQEEAVRAYEGTLKIDIQ
jgi:atypical dual specificity phosphatase